MSKSQIATGGIADDAVTTAKTSYSAFPFRNIIINGDMSIAQRGTSQANAGSSGGEYQTIDRFKLSQSALGAFTWSQDTDTPTGQGFANSMKFDCTTADASPSASDYFIISQILEGQMLQHLKKGTANAESLTLSFWVKSNKTGTYVAELFDNDNTRLFGLSYTINSTNTWEKKTLTFVGDTTGTLNNDNDKSLTVNFWLGAGTTFTAGSLQTWGGNTSANRAAGQVNLADSTDNEWYITGVQLEVGTSASDFEFLPFDVNLQRCQRYYQRPMDFDNTIKGRPICYTHSSVAVRATQELPVTMRTAGTYFASTVTNGYRFTIGGSNKYLNTVTGTPEINSVFHNADITGLGFPSNSQGHMFVNASGAYVELDAEL